MGAMPAAVTRLIEELAELPGVGRKTAARLTFFLLRDQWVSFLRSIGAMYQVDAKANWSGKARTVISFPAVCIIYYYLEAPEGYLWGLLPFYRWPALIYALEGLCLGINVVSIWVYTAAYWPALRKEAETPGK